MSSETVNAAMVLRATLAYEEAVRTGSNMDFAMRHAIEAALSQPALGQEDGLGEFKPCVIVNEEAGITEAVFEDVAYVAEPVFDGICHYIDKHLAMDDGRLVGFAVWQIAPLAPEVPDTGGLVEPTVFIDEQGVAQVIEGHGDAIKALFAAMKTPTVGRKILALVPAVSRAEAAAELSRLRDDMEELLQREDDLMLERNTAREERREAIASFEAAAAEMSQLRERVAELELMNRSKIVSYRDEQTALLTAATEDNKRLREALVAARADLQSWVDAHVSAGLKMPADTEGALRTIDAALTFGSPVNECSLTDVDLRENGDKFAWPGDRS